MGNGEKNLLDSYFYNGLKVAVVSDLHVGVRNSRLDKLEKIVQKINDKKPDIIFILGDYDAYYINKTYSTNEISNTLKKFKSKYATISVLGNHDYNPSNIVKECLEDTEIILLENESLDLKINNKKLKVVGLKDFWNYPKTNVFKTIGIIDSPAIVLSHNPDLFVKIPKDISLTLSGHTHGGDIRFPIIGSLFTPSNYGERFSKGHIIEKNKHLFVTSGTTTTTGVRFLNPPEIVFLTLFCEEKPPKDTKNLRFKKNYQAQYTKIARILITELRSLFSKH